LVGACTSVSFWAALASFFRAIADHAVVAISHFHSES